MLLTELPAQFEDRFSYPVSIETVLARMGTVEVESPDGTDSETIASILGPLEADTYDSARTLFETIYGNLNDDHIGRKYYDDRGGNVSGDGGGRDETALSF